MPISGTEPSPAGAERKTRPERFSLRDIDLPVLPVGVAEDGMMELPTSAFTIGWYEFGARPADRAGTTVLAGHVDTKAEGLGPLAALRRVDEGTRITLSTAGGTARRYSVTEVKIIRKARVPLDQIFAREGPETLVRHHLRRPVLPLDGLPGQRDRHRRPGVSAGCRCPALLC